jgi:hypothetical protein
MTTSILATAAALSDQDLLARLDTLAGRERETTVEIVAHLAALEMRPSAYAARGYGSLFTYCTQALRLSEDAAYNRTVAARACRRFPAILDLLGSGAMSLTAIRLLEPHLTFENYEAVLAKAARRTRREVERLVAELAPRPDAAASVRRVTVPKEVPPAPMCAPVAGPPTPASTADTPSFSVATAIEVSPSTFVLSPRPTVQASAPQRYRVQCTIGEEAHDDLRQVQTLLRREIPDGDPGRIFARALRLLREKIEKEKLGLTRYRPTRPGTGRNVTAGRAAASRHVPAAVRRAVWLRDQAQCAFRSNEGKLCTEKTFLEFHHVQPYAMDGPATAANISLRCRRHNQYEAELVFGPPATRPGTTAAPRERS